MLLMAAMMLMTLAASAQDGKMAVGVNVDYGTANGYNALGLGAKFQYEFVEKVRGEASFNYFLPKNHFNVWDLNVNFHYLVPLGDKANFYPLLGLAYQTARVSVGNYSASDGNLGVNGGVGAECFVANNIKLNAEIKYQYVKDGDWPVFSVGAAYVF